MTKRTTNKPRTKKQSDSAPFFHAPLFVGEIMSADDHQVLVELNGAVGQVSAEITETNRSQTDIHLTSKARNRNFLIKLLKHRLQSSFKTKALDKEGNITYIDADIFSDGSLAAFLDLAISGFNQTPTFTSFTLDNDQFVTTFAELLVEGATINALSSQALIERGREFGMQDAGGIAFTPPNIAEMLNAQFAILLKHHQAKLERIKAAFKITDQTGQPFGRQRYVIDKQHGKFPPGTECWASRPDRSTILFEFDDGTKMKLEGDWFLMGLEFPMKIGHKPVHSEEVIKEPSSAMGPLMMLFGALAGAALAGMAKTNEVRVADTVEPVEETYDSADSLASEEV
jgi:hypothetical protein